MATINKMVNGVLVSVNVEASSPGKYMVSFLAPPGAGGDPQTVNGDSSTAIESNNAENGCTYTLVPINVTWDEVERKNQVNWLVQCTA